MENFLRKKQRKKFEFFSKKCQFGIRKSNIHVTKEYKAPQNNRKKKETHTGHSTTMDTLTYFVLNRFQWR